VSRKRVWFGGVERERGERREKEAGRGALSFRWVGAPCLGHEQNLSMYGI